MALYAIGDLHLSLNSDKPMDIFGEKWHGYVDKIRAGFAPLHEDDVTVLCGDLSWGMSRWRTSGLSTPCRERRY